MNVDLRQISKHFGGVRANDRISLVIRTNTIHGLLGENGAGKTTLMRMLAGHIRPDNGQIRIDDRPVSFASPGQAAGLGIGMLHQDSMAVPVFSALENFMLGRARGGTLKKSYFRRSFSDMAANLGFSVPPHEKAAFLTPGARQQLDVIRLLSMGTRLLILDEPTTGLTTDQRSVLFEALRRFAAEPGHSVVLVSHKIADIEQLCDDVTVLRRGRVAGLFSRPFNADQVMGLMFGTPLAREKRRPETGGEIIFTAAGVSAARGRAGLTVDHFAARRGEMVGLAGLEGSGQELFLKTAAGLLPPLAGRFTFDGRDITGSGYHRRRQKGLAYIPSDRLNTGLVPELTIADHFLVAGGAPLLKSRSVRARQRAEAALFRFRINGRPDTPARFLSGGNQQRLLLALLPPIARLLLLDKPTRGLDSESVALVWSTLQAFCGEGGAVVFASSDMDELLTMADRVAVFFSGHLVAELSVKDTSPEVLERAMIGNFRQKTTPFQGPTAGG